MEEKNNNHICFQPNKAGKYLCYMFLVFVVISTIFLFCKQTPLNSKWLFLLFDIYFIVLIGFLYRGLQIYITIDNDRIVIFDNVTKIQQRFYLKTFSNVYCIYIKGAPYFLFVGHEMAKKERYETIVRILKNRQQLKRYMDENGNLFFSVGSHYYVIKSIIESQIQFEETTFWNS